MKKALDDEKDPMPTPPPLLPKSVQPGQLLYRDDPADDGDTDDLAHFRSMIRRKAEKKKLNKPVTSTPAEEEDEITEAPEEDKERNEVGMTTVYSAIQKHSRFGLCTVANDPDRI